MAPAIDFAATRPTHVRWTVLGCITLVTILTYLDRLNLSIAAKYIQDELSLSTQTLGWVLSAFLLGYAAFQIPGGWAGDRFGPKRVLTIAIVLWSAFTALTALAPSLFLTRWIGVVGTLLLARFLVGAGEAATAPNGNKIIGNWVGSAHRGFGSSFNILGVGIGGAITPPLIAWLMQRYGWRASFYVAGLAGLGVALIWHVIVSDSPENHPRVNAQELAWIQASRGALRSERAGTARTPWGKMISSRSVWGLLLGYFCQGYPIYFYHTWFFLYLVRERHLSITEGSFWGSTPYLAIIALAPLGGLFSDSASRLLGKRSGRRIAVCAGMFSSAVLLWMGSATRNNMAAILMLAAGGGLNMFAATTYWATCIDLTTRFTGSLSGLMNTFGNLGGWVSPVATAYIATHWGWNRALDWAAAVSIACGIFFLLVRADENLDGAA